MLSFLSKLFLFKTFIKNYLKITKFLKFLPINFFIVSLFFNCTLSRETVQRPKKQAIQGSILYYSLVAQTFYNKKQYEKAIFNYEKILANFADQKNLYAEQLAWAYYEIGFNYFKLGNYPLALENFQIVLDDYDVLAAAILSRRIIAEINKKNPIDTGS